MRQLQVEHSLDTAQIADVQHLLSLAAHTDGRQPLSDHLLLDLTGGGSDGFVGLLLHDAQNADLAAYGQVSRGNDEWLFEVVIRPDRRDRMDLITTELLRAAIEAISSQGGGPLGWWVTEPSPAHRQIAVATGLVTERGLLQMRRPLPTGHEVTVETRAFRPGDDDAPWLRVNNRAFADHGEQGGWTLATLQQRQAEDWFDPEGFRIHEREGRMAAFCWTKVHPPEAGEPALGEIYVIAVDPDFHGAGLGRQLTLAGLASLSERGITVGMLYVDSDNVAATTLYERLGFEVSSTTTSFMFDVPENPPGHGTPTGSETSR